MITKIVNYFARKKLLRYKNVNAIGIGNKVTANLNTGKKCIKVFVTKKQKQPKDIVPKRILGIKTDVEEIGEIKLQKDTKRYMPLQGGCSIGHRAITAGTLGCIVYKKGVWDADTGDYIISPSAFNRFFSKFKLSTTDVPFILSNNHVLADSSYDTNMDKRGSHIYQPGPLDGGTAPAIAYLYDYMPYNVSKNYIPGHHSCIWPILLYNQLSYN